MRGMDAQRHRVLRALTVQDPDSKDHLWGQHQPPQLRTLTMANGHTLILAHPRTPNCPHLPGKDAGKMKMAITWLLWQHGLPFAATFSGL